MTIPQVQVPGSSLRPDPDNAAFLGVGRSEAGAGTSVCVFYSDDDILQVARIGTASSRADKYIAFAYHGNSMRGTFREGDVLWIAPDRLEMVEAGDIIAFYDNGSRDTSPLVVHRIKACTPAGLVTQGDFNATPDSELIQAEGFVGRARFVQRGDKIHRVWGGRLGQLWAGYMRLRKYLAAGRIASLYQSLYRLVKSSGLVRRLWRPTIVKIQLATNNGPLVKYIHNQRTIASWQSEQKRFRYRRPYDLVIDQPEKVN